jgi:hypothetical protein
VSNAGDTVVDTAEGKAIRARLDPVRNAKMRAEVCGDGLLRLMAVALEPVAAEREVLDLACGADRWLDGQPKPSGTPDASAWTLRALQVLGGSR